MGKNWILSDTHFNHQNILQYEHENRRFSSVEEMNEQLIKNWNEKISPEDTVWHLGDFILGMADGVLPILNRLNFKELNLIPGNHDTDAKIAIYEQAGVKVLPQLYDAKIEGTRFVLCHYPMQAWKGQGKGVIHAFGHVHQIAKSHRIEEGQILNYPWDMIHIGMDDHKLQPWSIEEILTNCNLRK